jgi:signal transduction histidine kinase
LAKLTQLSEVLVRTESKEQILSLATEHTKEILSADRVSVATINPKAPDYLDLYANNTENKSHFETTIQLKGSGLDTTIFSKKAHYTSEISPDHEMVDQIKAQAIAPLITGQNVLGTLNLGFLSPREMTGQEKDIFLQISSLIASALQNNQLFEQTQSRANQLATVADVSTAASTILDPDILLKTVVDLTKARFNLYHAHIYLLEGENLVLKAGAGEIGDIMVEQNWQIAASNPVSLVAKAARNLEGVIANNVQSDPLFLPNKHLPATRAELAIPMIAGEKLIGVLDVQSNFADAFSEQDVLIQSTLATQVAIALQNAELYLEQLKTAEQLREVDRLKTEFLARMSHELRTPLNSIIGFSDVLLEGLDGPLTPRMEEDVVVIRDSGRHLKELIGDILDLSKIEAGMMTLNLQPVELSMLCDEVMATSQGLAFEKKIELNLELPEIIEPVTIDRTRIKQVLINLVGNAIKFTDAGGVTISIKNETDNVRFEVIDTGIGIAPENLGLVFEEFRQVDGSLTRQSGGTGLGIPISKRLVELHGGVMGLDSEFGVGSTFWFTLPRTPQD